MYENINDGGKIMTRVAIYLRLSQEDEDKLNPTDFSQSIQNQRLMLENLTYKNGWEIYDIYSDDDYAGSDRFRPEFQRLLKDAEDKKFQIVLCKSQSRFTREMELVEKYIHTLFPMWGIRFIGAVDNADTNNKGNKKARQINGLINEWYLEDMSDNIRAILKSKCEAGKHIGSFACYGYFKDDQHKGGLIIDEEAAKNIRLIYNLYEQGYGQTKICQYLNDRNIRNPSAYKKSLGMKFKVGNSKGGQSWGTSTIRSILSNQMYIGSLVQHKKENISYKSKKQRKLPKEEWIIVENNHKPIITIDQFNAIQLLLKRNSKPNKTGVRSRYGGLLRCLYCDSPMLTTTSHGERYYKCRGKKVHNNCIGSFVNQKHLDQYILSEFQSFCAQYVNKSDIKNKIQIKSTKKEAIEDLKKDIQMLDKKINENNKLIRKIYIDKLKDFINEEDYTILSEEFRMEIERLKKNKEIIENDLLIVKNQQIDIISKEEIVNKCIDIKEVTDEIINELILKIEIGKRDVKTKILPIRIYWKF